MASQQGRFFPTDRLLKATTLRYKLFNHTVARCRMAGTRKETQRLNLVSRLQDDGITAGRIFPITHPLKATRNINFNPTGMYCTPSIQWRQQRINQSAMAVWLQYNFRFQFCSGQQLIWLGTGRQNNNLMTFSCDPLQLQQVYFSFYVKLRFSQN